jgi:DNA repair protein RadC
MQINQLPKEQRPREKLLSLGAEKLSDSELLAIFLRTGIAGCSAIELAQQLLAKHQSLQGLLSASLSEFCQTKGMGEAKYVQLQAVIELSRRFLQEPLKQRTVFDSPFAVTQYLQTRLKAATREQFVVLVLDSQNRLIHDEVLFVGSISAAAVYPREIVKLVLAYNGANVILAHNHPSGIAEPSEADKLITNKIVSALALIDVAVLDHLIIASTSSVSFAERGLV